MSFAHFETKSLSKVFEAHIGEFVETNKDKDETEGLTKDKMKENELAFAFILCLGGGVVVVLLSLAVCLWTNSPRHRLYFPKLFYHQQMQLHTMKSNEHTIIANGRTNSHHPLSRPSHHAEFTFVGFLQTRVHKISTTPRTFTMCSEQINVRNLPNIKNVRNGFSGEKFMYMYTM